MRLSLTLAALAALLVPSLTFAEDEKPREGGSKEKLTGVPETLRGFSGMLIGTLVDKDVEEGELTVDVQHVARVWRNNKAKNPRSVVGRRVVLNNITGKWLDTVLILKKGETLEFEAQHQRGDALRFPGEWLKKVEPFKAENYPSPPNEFRGFQGLVIGTIEQKRTESRELVVKVKDIGRPFKGNRAKKPESAVGKRIVVAGFWGRMQKPFDPLKKGDTIRFGLQHRVTQSDHFSVIEGVAKVGADAKIESRPKEEPRKDRPVEKEVKLEKPADPTKFPEDALRGFRGVLVGKVLSRDAEKGVMTIDVERVPRVFRNNKASVPKRAQGYHITLTGISGRFVDTLLLLKKGDRVEVAAFHNRGTKMDFPGELLRKAKTEKEED